MQKRLRDECKGQVQKERKTVLCGEGKGRYRGRKKTENHGQSWTSSGERRAWKERYNVNAIIVCIIGIPHRKQNIQKKNMITLEVNKQEKIKTYATIRDYG